MGWTSFFARLGGEKLRSPGNTILEEKLGVKFETIYENARRKRVELTGRTDSIRDLERYVDLSVVEHVAAYKLYEKRLKAARQPFLKREEYDRAMKYPRELLPIPAAQFSETCELAGIHPEKLLPYFRSNEREAMDYAAFHCWHKWIEGRLEAEGLEDERLKASTVPIAQPSNTAH